MQVVAIYAGVACEGVALETVGLEAKLAGGEGVVCADGTDASEAVVKIAWLADNWCAALAIGAELVTGAAK